MNFLIVTAQKAQVDLIGKRLIIRGKVQRLSASSEDSGGDPLRVMK